MLSLCSRWKLHADIYSFHFHFHFVVSHCVRLIFGFMVFFRVIVLNGLSRSDNSSQGWRRWSVIAVLNKHTENNVLIHFYFSVIDRCAAQRMRARGNVWKNASRKAEKCVSQFTHIYAIKEMDNNHDNRLIYIIAFGFFSATNKITKFKFVCENLIRTIVTFRSNGCMIDSFFFLRWILFLVARCCRMCVQFVCCMKVLHMEMDEVEDLFRLIFYSRWHTSRYHVRTRQSGRPRWSIRCFSINSSAPHIAHYTQCIWSQFFADSAHKHMTSKRLRYYVGIS